MRRRFVIEAVMVATYGHLLVPSRPVDYVVPYSTIAELYDMKDGADPVMEDPSDDKHVKEKIGELISFFEDPLNRKKIERALQVPWRESSPLLLNDKIQFTIVHALDNAQYGELFDPIETEVLLAGMKLDTPILSDQIEFQERLIEAEIPVLIYDIDDFEFAVEEGIEPDEFQEHRDL
ncbi:ADP-heptose synthase [Paenibacillus sp. MMS18-CY102]|uniref:ADP-heptose synthase n=1 Tax=Paenibacillus sp. MMS18-CY102 TaxID=2682849 RepID=UPI001365B039|nr:ADP-heptose synthase [Paenibacillus sp. MMS18-CY102]MWC28227.1 ADP-heptose synthase [Paenibacillus sp. MMS18-CY102]